MKHDQIYLILLRYSDASKDYVLKDKFKRLFQSEQVVTN